MTVLRGYIYAILSAVLVSTIPIFAKLMLAHTNAQSGGIYFFGMAFIIISIIIIVRRQFGQLKVLKTYWKPLLILGIFNAAGSILWWFGINDVGPNLTTFLLRFENVFSVVLGLFFLKEKLNKYEAIGIFIAITGAFMITRYSNNGSISLISVGIIFFAALLFSGAHFVSKMYVKKTGAFMMNYSRIIFSFIFMFFFAYSTNSFIFPNQASLEIAVAGGILSTVLGITFFLKALEHADLSKVISIRAMDPFIVVIYSYFVLATVPDMIQLAGGTVVILGILIIVQSRNIRNAKGRLDDRTRRYKKNLIRHSKKTLR